jgi:hypothetical protein
MSLIALLFLPLIHIESPFDEIAFNANAAMVGLRIRRPHARHAVEHDNGEDEAKRGATGPYINHTQAWPVIT